MLTGMPLSSVIPACPESFFKKDSRRTSFAGMTNTYFILAFAKIFFL